MKLAQNQAQVMFGVLRYVYTCSALHSTEFGPILCPVLRPKIKMSIELHPWFLLLPLLLPFPLLEVLYLPPRQFPLLGGNLLGPEFKITSLSGLISDYYRVTKVTHLNGKNLRLNLALGWSCSLWAATVAAYCPIPNLSQWEFLPF